MKAVLKLAAYVVLALLIGGVIWWTSGQRDVSSAIGAGVGVTIGMVGGIFLRRRFIKPKRQATNPADEFS